MRPWLIFAIPVSLLFLIASCGERYEKPDQYHAALEKAEADAQTLCPQKSSGEIQYLANGVCLDGDQFDDYYEYSASNPKKAEAFLNIILESSGTCTQSSAPYFVPDDPAGKKCLGSIDLQKYLIKRYPLQSPPGQPASGPFDETKTREPARPLSPQSPQSPQFPSTEPQCSSTKPCHAYCLGYEKITRDCRDGKCEYVSSKDCRDFGSTKQCLNLPTGAQCEGSNECVFDADCSRSYCDMEGGTFKHSFSCENHLCQKHETNCATATPAARCWKGECSPALDQDSGLEEYFNKVSRHW